LKSRHMSGISISICTTYCNMSDCIDRISQRIDRIE
jgi:hypothetical protein